MLKRQEPHDYSLYTAVDPIRITELHLKGFMPEYIYGKFVYFRTSDKLTKYLNGEDISEPKSESVKEIKVEETEPKENKYVPSTKKKEK